MVKLSDIIRKDSKERGGEKPGLISEVAKKREDEESLPEIKKLYEDIIFETKMLMVELKAGKIINGKDVFGIAELIVDKIHTCCNPFLSLTNIFAFHGEKEDYLYSHSVNVSILATKMALSLGYEESKLIDFGASSLLHDIGMLKIAEEIINKPSELTEEERDLIKKHPLFGLELLKNIKEPPKFAPEVIYQHHERIDGSGYPEGKREQEISERAKVVAITEVYEAITHPRPYRQKKHIPYDGVKTIIHEEKGAFDLKLIKVFLNFITPYPVGSFVLLNTGEIGRVIGVNENLPLRPIVEIYYDHDGKPPLAPKRIDLSKSTVLCIERAVDESTL